MTEQPKSDDKPQDSNRRSSKPAKRPNRKGRGRLWMWLALALIAVVVALGIIGWYLWNDLREEQEQRLSQIEARFEKQQAGLEQELEAVPQQLRQEFSETSKQLNERLQKQTRQQAEVIDSLQRQLQNINRRLRAMSNTDREDWKLAEAEYLLRLANQRLVMERDGGNALVLAQQADEILRNISDPDLFPIRRALSQGINELKAVERIDREGLYLQLLALSEDIGQLPLVQPVLGEDTPAENSEQADPPPPSDARFWERVRYRISQSFKNLWGRLSDHVRIRRNDEAVRGLVPPNEEFYLRQNLQLMLEQAQIALLREQLEIYQRNLQRAADWLGKYYAASPDTQAVQDELRDLAQVRITQSLPDLNDALSMLQDYVDRLHQSGDQNGDQGNEQNDEESNT